MRVEVGTSGKGVGVRQQHSRCRIKEGTTYRRRVVDVLDHLEAGRDLGRRQLRVSMIDLIAKVLALIGGARLGDGGPVSIDAGR
jgi:hypothetical protein